MSISPERLEQFKRSMRAEAVRRIKMKIPALLGGLLMAILLVPYTSKTDITIGNALYALASGIAALAGLTICLDAEDWFANRSKSA